MIWGKGRKQYYFSGKTESISCFCIMFFKKKKGFLCFVENNAEILDEISDENRRIHASILTTELYSQTGEKPLFLYGEGKDLAPRYICGSQENRLL